MTFATIINNPIKATLSQSNSVVQNTINTFFNMRSLAILIASLVVSIALGRLLSIMLHRVSDALSRRADRASTFNAANYLRNWETYIILSIALIRMLLVILAISFWWQLTHPTGSSNATAIISAGAILTLVLSGAIGPLLRDFMFGAGMMAEHWFGVGDFIAVDQIPNAQGVVERVTLRSTRIRSVNGEVMWITNQNISSARVAPRGVILMAIELFVTDPEQGASLIEATNLRLPTSAVAVATELGITQCDELSQDLWHIMAVGEVAAGREWFLERFAVQVMQDLDKKSKHPVLVHDPIVRYADPVAEHRFERSIQRARKAARQRKRTLRSKRLPTTGQRPAKNLDID